MSITDRATRTTLTDEQLVRCRERAAGYDRANEFFTEDFEELRTAGYLLAAVPEAYGGWGLDLEQLSTEQRRLARHAPATALALSMHLYWTGMAADLQRFGDASCAWMLEAARDGAVFASGHAEVGNDVPLLLSTTDARRVDGGWELTGRKLFGSLSPVWTFLGAHAMDTSDPTAPKVVHTFIERGTPGVETIETWDTLGMRATQSHDTSLQQAFVPDARVGDVTPAGVDSLFTGVMSVWALTLISNVYTGIAERAFELAVRSATRKSSIAIPRGTYAHNPMVQHQIAEMYLELEAPRAMLDRLAGDWAAGVDHGDELPLKLAATKWRAVETAKEVVDIAVDVVGGGAMFTGDEIERLYRDVRAGGFHPTNAALTFEVIGKAVLGVTDDDGRW